MIKEFAIDPAVMATWEHFQLLWDDFGAGRGRLICKYPLSWSQKVAELSQSLSKPVRASAILAKIQADKHKLLTKPRAYSGDNDWLENAEGQPATQKFHAIIALANPRKKPEVLVSGEFDKSIPPYALPHNCKIPRTAAALAGCANLILQNCEEIQMVDPHFDPAEKRWVDTFEAILAIRVQNQRLKILEIHTEKRETFNRSNREYYLKKNLQALVHQGVTLRVFYWSSKPGGERLHPRFLLTELGGIQFDYGLDTGGSEADTTIVTLMDRELWLLLRKDYSVPSPTFTLGSDCIIEISGKRGPKLSS